MTVVRRRPNKSARRFPILRFIAYLIVLVGALVLIGGLLVGLYGLAVSPILQVGDQVYTPFITITPPAFIAAAIVVGLAIVGGGHLLLAILSIEQHTRRSTLAQEKMLRAHAQLMRELDQRLP